MSSSWQSFIFMASFFIAYIKPTQSQYLCSLSKGAGMNHFIIVLIMACYQFWSFKLGLFSICILNIREATLIYYSVNLQNVKRTHNILLLKFWFWLVFLGRVPVRLYVWNVCEDFDDLEDAPPIDSWDKVSYINRPVEIQGEGKTIYLFLIWRNNLGNMWMWWVQRFSSSFFYCDHSLH